MSQINYLFPSFMLVVSYKISDASIFFDEKHTHTL